VSDRSKPKSGTYRKEGNEQRRRLGKENSKDGRGARWRKGGKDENEMPREYLSATRKQPSRTNHRRAGGTLKNLKMKK